MKTALVHDWLVTAVGGSENSFRQIYSMYPGKIHTLMWDPKVFKGTELEGAEVKRSFIERLPWAKKKFRHYVPLFPLAIEQFDLTGYDLILSSSHCVAKGVISHPDQLHICYCYTPVRYVWDLSIEYLRESGLDKGLKGTLARLCMHYMRGWDVHSSHRVDHFVAISHFIARRIRRTYGREAKVIYPPVNVDYYALKEKKDNYYVAASRLVGYKKIDLIVEAFSQMPDCKLVVIGDGPDLEKVKRVARPNVELMGYQPNQVLREMLQNAKAMIFAAVEDFGILPIEAMAAGTPVIALRKGGAAETVIEGLSGLFFEEQSVASICEAVRRFERMEGWDGAKMRQYAMGFSEERFRNEYRTFVEEKKAEWRR